MRVALMIVDVVFGLAVMASILLQQGHMPGLSGAFGGGGSGPQMYAKKRGVDDFLERVTVVLSIIFAIVTLILVHIW